MTAGVLAKIIPKRDGRILKTLQEMGQGTDHYIFGDVSDFRKIIAYTNESKYAENVF